MSSKPFKLQTIRPEYLEGEPHAIINRFGEVFATVMVNPEKKMWGVIRHWNATTGEFFRMTAKEINADGWAVWRWKRIPQGEAKDPLVWASDFIVRDESVRDSLIAQCDASYRKWDAELRARRDAEFKANWARYQNRPSPFRTYTVAECRQQLQRHHPDRGGDAEIFVLWKDRLDAAKRNERTAHHGI